MLTSFRWYNDSLTAIEWHALRFVVDFVAEKLGACSDFHISALRLRSDVEAVFGGHAEIVDMHRVMTYLPADNRNIDKCIMILVKEKETPKLAT